MVYCNEHEPIQLSILILNSMDDYRGIKPSIKKQIDISPYFM